MELPDDLDLTEIEWHLWDAVMAGRGVSFGDGDPRQLASADDWGPKRTIRGRVLAELLIRAGASGPPATRQVAIHGARVTGEVYLGHADMAASVQLKRCLFDHHVILRLAHARTLELDTCVLASVDATGASIDGLLEITQSKVGLGICLAGAKISQSVALSGSTIAGNNGQALNAEGLEVGGSMFLDSPTADSDRFHADGEVRLLNAQIAGQLNCTGGRFNNPGGIALGADSAEIQGSVFLGKLPDVADGFHATGEVRLVNAQIAGQLNCSGGRFDNGKRHAFAADGTKIGGSVFLNSTDDNADRFHATGEVRLSGVRIAGQLNCAGARVDNPERTALSVDMADIHGGALLNRGFHATGEVQLLGARIGGQLNCRGGRFENPKRAALNLEHAQVNTLLLRGPSLQVAGDVCLFGARVSTLADDPADLDGQEVTLHLDGFSYERIAPNSPDSMQDAKTRLQWLERQLRGHYFPQPYDQLAAVFRRNGQDYEARNVLVEKRRKRRKTLSGTRQGRFRKWLRKGWDILLEKSVLYGWQPWRPLVFGVAALMIGLGLVTAAQLMGLVIEPPTPWFVPIFLILDVFLPIVDLGVNSNWEIATEKGGAFAWIVTGYLWSLTLVGWGTVTLAVAALTGIVKRE